MKNKRGKVELDYIIKIIILVISFIILTAFIAFGLNLGRESDKQICHNSVVLRSTPGIKLVTELNCKTNYLCISGGGKCKGINPTSTVKVNPNNKEEIIEAIADEMADCWWMFGEGELDYLRLFEKGIAKTNCAICSIVRFDEKILDKNYKISYREGLEYLNSIDKDEDMSYFAYLYDSPNIDEFISRGGFFGIDIDNNYILDDDEYVIVTGFKKEAKVEKIGDILKPVKEYIIYPSYLKSNQVSSVLGCGEFITKA